MPISEEMEQQTMYSILTEVKWELEEPHKIKAWCWTQFLKTMMDSSEIEKSRFTPKTLFKEFKTTLKTLARASSPQESLFRRKNSLEDNLRSPSLGKILDRVRIRLTSQTCSVFHRRTMKEELHLLIQPCALKSLALPTKSRKKIWESRSLLLRLKSWRATSQSRGKLSICEEA